MKATKKKKNLVVEDFIDSLVEDLNTSIDLTGKSKTALDIEPSIASPLGPIALGKKNKASVMLGSESNQPDLENQNSTHLSLKTSKDKVLQTQLMGIDLVAAVVPTDLEKLRINEDATQSMPKVEVFGLDDSHVLRAVTPLLKSPTEDSMSKSLNSTSDVPNLEKPQEIQNIFEIPELVAESAQDDATIPLGGYPAFPSEIDKTIPPDPRHYIGQDQKKYQQGAFDPEMYNPEIYNPEMYNPEMYNPEIINSEKNSSDADLKISDEFAQAEHLRIAQQRIFQLEKENDHLRSENDELASAADIVKNRVEEYIAKISNLEQEIKEEKESFQSEVFILKGSLQHKENDNTKLKLKVEDLEARLRTDFRKIRVRERELENRLELLKAEKLALVRAKDENILELRRKMDTLQNEIESYRSKMLELNHIIDTNQDQFKRTVKALRLALSSLEIKDENVIPLKKAE